MDVVYVGQTSLRLELDSGVDLSTASAVVIKYVKPDSSIGTWTVTVSGTLARHDFANASELDIPGVWVAWVYATFADGRKAPGSPVQFTVKKEGIV